MRSGRTVGQGHPSRRGPVPDRAADAAKLVPPSRRTRLLARLRRCGFGYECFRIFRIGLETALPTKAEVLPEGCRFRELAGADVERADDASIRGCAWYGGAVSVHLRNVEAERGGGFATAL